MNDALAKLTNLETLDLSNNRFNGALSGLFLLMNELRSLNISQNAFQGDAMTSFSPRLSKLQSLDVGHNEFSGYLPIDELNSLSKLTLLQMRGPGDLERQG